MAEQAHIHHYVPQWYQRHFFLPGQTKYFYLDLHPETVVSKNIKYTRRDLLHWGSASCFYKDDLYMLSFPVWTSDQIEKIFFGKIDTRGREAVAFFADYKKYSDQVVDLFPDLPLYMDAQRFRTPRGLERLKALIQLQDHNQALVAMQALFRFHSTMWTEGVWEIVRARTSATKFILSDEPVTFFNRRIFPKELQLRAIELDQVGTRTIFPLSIDACLIVTHVQFVRNPWIKPNKTRVNARAYQPTMQHLLDLQFGRELQEDEVMRINYIMKQRATRYIAAANKDWLYPERRLSDSTWSKFDDDWFLLPHLYKVPFTTEYVAGNDEGMTWASDEYGRHPRRLTANDEKRREQEWATHLSAKKEWAKKRIGKSFAHVSDKDEERVGNKMMNDYLRKEGLLPPAPTSD